MSKALGSNMFEKLKQLATKKRREEKLERERQAMRQTIISASQASGLQHIFEQSVREAELGQMTVGVSILSPGIGPLEYALAKFLLPGKEASSHLSTSYSWDAFARTVIEKLNEQIPGEAQYGYFEYITKNGLEIKRVTDQDAFEVALIHLHHKRKEDEVLPFQWRPESAEDESLRVISSVQNRPETSALVEPEPEEPVISEHETVDTSQQIDSPTEAVSAVPAVSPDATETKETESKRTSAQSTAATDDRPSTSAAPAPAPGALTRKKTTSKPTLKDTIRKIRGKETLEEKRIRLTSLWEADRTFYKKGDEAEEDEDLEQIAERDSQDGSISDEEDDDEEETSHEDKVVMKLQNMLNLPELAQLTDPTQPKNLRLRWKECCEMFAIDPSKTGIEERVTIAGLKTPIYQYQAFGIYWQMTTSRLHGGGFVADDMGLGKTLSFLAYMVVERQLSCLWQQVNRSRALKNNQHLPQAGQAKDAQCPSPRKPGWIVCPCADSSPTKNYAPKAGLRMACVPAALVRSWWEQWKTHVDTTTPELGLNIVVDHRGAFDFNTSSEDLSFRSDSGRSTTRTAAERYKKKDGKGDDAAKPYQDGFLILTTKETFPAWVKKYHTYEGLVRVDGKDEWKKGSRVQLVFGIAMIDESHEEAMRGKGRAKILLDLPKVNAPFLWGYSGTPFSMTPRGLEGVLWAIEKHTQANGEQHSNYPELSCSTLNKICQDFANQKDLKEKTINDDAIDAVLKRFKPFLTTFVIRRDQQSKWFGHSLIKINLHIHQDIRLKQVHPIYTPQELIDFEAGFQEEKDAMLLKLQQKFDAEKDTRSSNVRPTKLPFNTMCREQWRLSLLATFPYLLKLATAEDEKVRMTLTEAEALGLRGSDNKEKDSGYYKHIKSIVESSPKALWLYDFIHGLDAQRDVNGDEQKLVMVTQFPQVAFILKLFMQVYFPDKKDRVGLVTGRMNLKERSETIDAFTGENKASKRDVQILIGTTRLLGVGLQLTRACNIILMEPDHHYVRELQGYARVHRIGQKNPFSFSYRLIDESSEIEARILKRQADRKELPGRKLTEEEVQKLVPVVEGEEGKGKAAEGVAGPSGT